MKKRGREVAVVGAFLGFVVLFCLSVGVAPPLGNTREQRASLGCKGIAQAVEAYISNPSSSNVRPPDTLNDLLRPAFGGPSFLRNGEEDLIDPWGRQYQMERYKRDSEERPLFLIHTTSPDGTQISQFGIGPASKPPADWIKVTK